MGESLHAESAGDLGRKPGAHRAIGVTHIVGELHFLAIFETRAGVAQHAHVEAVGNLVAPLDRRVARKAAGIRLQEQGIEIEIVEVLAAAAHLLEEVGAADDLVEGACPQRGEDVAHVFGDEREEVDDLFRRAFEPVAQRGLLRANSDGQVFE